MTDRSHWPTRKLKLGEDDSADYSALTPGERVELVEVLTRQAWTFKEGRWDEPRLRRDLGRVVRRGG